MPAAVDIRGGGANNRQIDAAENVRCLFHFAASFLPFVFFEKLQRRDRRQKTL